MSSALVVLFVGLATACAPAIAWHQPEAVASSTAIDVDGITGTTEVTGPWFGGGRDAGEAMRLWARTGADGHTSFEVHVRANGRAGWAEYTHAVDPAGQTYPVEDVDRDISCRASGCYYVEDVSAELTRTRLERAARSALTLRLYGQRGFDDYRLPGSYVAGFLLAVGE